ncbi:hypothetical protein GcM3_006009 [Golovinomyces cichoracearum]|uniref:HAUS augmin-like complex subunit 1 n=1 Tax=Golovinomyces cichoracearum TaxID=62708 RepID=A0A420JAR4_9PEZI|nr:hypothetical protein GcM3_006009 [Golovinomyces cichoracearum]
MADLSPAAIFSPSVAKKQRAIAKDWSYVDDWLVAKFKGKLPLSFERNGDTLKALLALASFNESADEEDALMLRVESKALENLQKEAANDRNRDLIELLDRSLTRDGKSSLDAISNLSVAINRPLPRIEALGQKIIDLQVENDILDQTSDRIKILETHLNTELENIDILREDLHSPSYQPKADLVDSVINHQLKIKEIISSLPERQDRLALLSTTYANQPKITIQDVNLAENKLKELSNVVRELEKQVLSFHGLPKDTNLARLELENKKAELFSLIKTRDEMFEGLVEKKGRKGI